MFFISKKTSCLAPNFVLAPKVCFSAKMCLALKTVFSAKVCLATLALKTPPAPTFVVALTSFVCDGESLSF